MSGRDDGGPAFPGQPVGRLFDGTEIAYTQKGMTLRDYFAAHAPQPEPEAIVAEMRRDQSRNPHNEARKPRIRDKAQIIAALRYAYADATLAERNKRGTP